MNFVTLKYWNIKLLIKIDNFWAFFVEITWQNMSSLGKRKDYCSLRDALRQSGALDSSIEERESQYARFCWRTQVLTSAYKTDSYFAEKDGRYVFIKGPILSDQVDNFLAFQQIKQQLGLPVVSSQVVFHSMNSTNRNRQSARIHWGCVKVWTAQSLTHSLWPRFCSITHLRIHHPPSFTLQNYGPRRNTWTGKTLCKALYWLTATMWTVSCISISTRWWPATYSIWRTWPCAISSFIKVRYTLWMKSVWVFVIFRGKEISSDWGTRAWTSWRLRYLDKLATYRSLFHLDEGQERRLARLVRDLTVMGADYKIRPQTVSDSYSKKRKKAVQE